MKEAALAYLRAGMTITPLCWPNEEGACGAGHPACSTNPRSVGKVPLTKDGRIVVFGPGQDDEARAFWEEHPSANIGIRLEESGILVIDIDDLDLVPPAQRAVLEQFAHYVQSGRGRHIYFRRGDLPAVNLKQEGWEIRGKGHVVAPPSVHRSGTPYRWSEGTTMIYPTVPDMVAELIRKTPHLAPGVVAVDWENLPDVDISRIPLSMETRELIRFGAPKGHRSEAIWRVIGDLVRAGCDDAVIAAVLTNPEYLISEKVLEKSPAQRRKYVEQQIAKMRAELAERAAEGKAPAPPPAPSPAIRTAREIWETEYPEPAWLVEGILTEGLTILGGRSKIGKSWLVLDLAVSVALGRPVWGGVPTEQAGVLYLALEDTERRIKSRMASVLKGDPAPDNLYISTTWPRLMERDAQDGSRVWKPEGIKRLHQFLKDRDHVRLVIVDTFAKFRTLWDRNTDIYQRDYHDVGLLKELADVLGVAVVLVHHHRKGGSDDIGESLSGSVGIPGAADAIWSLTRKGRQGTLAVTGRDVEEKVYRLDFAQDGYWVWCGEEKEVEQTEEELSVIAIMEELGEISPAQLAEELSISVEAAKKRLQRMEKRGLLRRVGRGKYCLVSNSVLNSPPEE